jgi:hypothetical protein
MTSTQLDNLVNFTFNFNKSMGNHVLSFDYDYIIEKWTKYINVFEFKEIEVNLELENFYQIWSSKWNYNDSPKKILPILKVLISINSKPLQGINLLTIDNIVDSFNEIININNVSKVSYNSNHHLIKDRIVDFKERNKREINLILLEYA